MGRKRIHVPFALRERAATSDPCLICVELLGSGLFFWSGHHLGDRLDFRFRIKAGEELVSLADLKSPKEAELPDLLVATKHDGFELRLLFGVFGKSPRSAFLDVLIGPRDKVHDLFIRLGDPKVIV